MGDEHEERYAARRVAFERQLQELPSPGTPAYWQRIEHAHQASALPLEVLARCLRERCEAGAPEHARRIFECVLRRIQSRTRYWAWAIASQCHSDKPKMQEDLQQSCYLALWKELIDDGPTFLLENFLHTLDRIQQHVAHDLMEKAGEWKRNGVKTSTRVSPQDTKSLSESVDPDEDLTLEDILSNPDFQKDFEHAEQSGDIFPLINRLPSHLRAVIHDRFWRGLTEEEIAREQQVTDRTIRNWLKQALALLRKWYLGGEEDYHG